MAKKQFPFLLEDRTGCIPSSCPIVALGDTFEGVRIIRKDLWPEVKIVDSSILWAHIADNVEASRKENTIYYRAPEQDPTNVKKNVDHLRYMALEYGATPEAIRLLDEMSAFTDKEKKKMAEKLKAKASAAKPDKEGLKSAAKAAPVSKKVKKGNDNLAKARAAKGPPPNRKYKGLVKAKDLKLRGWTQRMAQIALNNTTTEAANAELKADKSFSGKRIDYAWLASKGIISKPA